MPSFNFTYAPGTSLEQMIGFELAGRIWSQFLSDPGIINIHVQMTNQLPSNVIGGGIPGFISQYKFADFYKKLQTDITSSTDQAAYANMFTHAKGFHAVIEANGSSEQITAIQGINMTRANAKALNILSTTDPKLDGFILMRNFQNQPIQWSYDFVAANGVPSQSLDFLSTALHEIGHILGFTSGIDDPDWFKLFQGRFQNNQKLDGKKLQFVSVLDMFRYSLTSVNTYGEMPDMSIGGNSRFFSLDGGVTPLARFETSKFTDFGGTGLQASHWQGAVGLMAATMRLGERLSISNTDLIAMDAIGWDRSSVPTTGLDLVTLLNQSKQQLAQQMGVTVSWMDANPTLAIALAPLQLVRDRTLDVTTMLADSGVPYEGRSNGGSGSWQEILETFVQEGIFDTLDEEFSNLVRPKGTRRHDRLHGSTGDDVIRGRSGNDRLAGYMGNNRLYGGLGNDTLLGGSDTDYLVGDRGSDRLMGNAGEDYLCGGIGNDVLFGGVGQDVFVVEALPGLDIVKDFTPGEDKLKLSGNLKWEQLQVEQRGRHALLGSRDQSLMLLQNVQATLITAADVL
jgi:hypothetical protein